MKKCVRLGTGGFKSCLGVKRRQQYKDHFLYPQTHFLSGVMIMSRKAINFVGKVNSDSLLGADNIAPATPILHGAPFRLMGLGIFTAFERSRELRRGIKFAAQTQSARLG